MKSLADQIANSCVNFNGVQHDRCKAGVAYESFTRPGLPCLKDFCNGHTCEHLHYPTPEEVASKVAASDAYYAASDDCPEPDGPACGCIGCVECRCCIVCDPDSVGCPDCNPDI